jgi:hypothetical protein
MLDAIPAASRPRIVCYSTAMARPEVNIPLRGAGVGDGFYDVAGVVDQLDAIAVGEMPNQVPLPGPDDWAALDPGLPVGADVAAAHQRMQDHERAWRQIWDAEAPFDRTAQMWISRNILPLLGLSSTDGYRIARTVVRKVAGLPFRLI